MATRYRFVREMREVANDEYSRIWRKMRRLGADPTLEMPRWFMPVEVGDGVHYLSIQASAGHYCSPRMTIDKRLYESYEVAMMCRDASCEKGARFVTVGEFLPGVECDELVIKVDEYASGGNETIIYPNLPADLVEQIYLKGCEIYGK